MSLAAADSAGNTAKSGSGGDTAARTPGIAGLGMGVLGFGTAIVALRRRNDQPSTASSASSSN